MPSTSKIHICLISIHGLIRGHDLELGRDADTGGQTKYVVELARALAEHPQVGQVELLTRLVEAPGLSPDYAQPIEEVSPGFRIVRIPAGPEGYTPKEQLWDSLDSFVDNALHHIGQQGQSPDLLHSHYADAGYVGSRMAHILGIPLVHTGHSLGRVKRQRLLASGLDAGQIEQRYQMKRRIEAEELTLATAELVITSTHQEIEEQYEVYDFYQPAQMRVIPPGTDLSCFHPPLGLEWQSDIANSIRRFLHHPERPMILALSRPDPRKNISALVQAFGEDEELKEAANLVIIAGNREDIRELDEGAQEVFGELLNLIDRHDLYGKVAYPKQHQSTDVALIYRLAAHSGGVFVNPALTEPFGLTLIEAAASGLPLVATEDGGPRDILANCHNGILIDPLDPTSIAQGLKTILFDWECWQDFARKGLEGVRQHYSWQAHINHYLKEIKALLAGSSPPLERPAPGKRPHIYNNRAIFSDLDQNLLASPEALPELIDLLRKNRKCATFGIATGRRLDSALQMMKKFRIPEPDVLITSGGTEIYYAPKLNQDEAWARHIEKQWSRKSIARVLESLPGLRLQPRSEQSRFKLSFFIDPALAPTVEDINQLLHQEELSANVVLSFGQYLDVLPIRASKGLALRYLANRWDLPLEHILVAGGSGADEDMMRGNTLAVVVGNRHHEELSQLADSERIYFAEREGAAGILEAIEHYDFFRSCPIQPDRTESTTSGAARP